MKKIFLFVCCLLITALTFGQAVKVIDEGFETVEASGVPLNWLSIDDGDGYQWRYLADGKARTGTGYVGTGNNSSGTSNDWLISPQLEVTENVVLSFFYRAGGAAWPDTISINISKTGTAEGDFTIHLDTIGTASEEYAKYSVNLTDQPGISAGDLIYIGLNYIGSGWYICVDDFSCDQSVPETLNEGFEAHDTVTYVPTGWISTDDGDGYAWRNSYDGKPRTDTGYVITGPYYPSGAGVTNDWLVTPQVKVAEGNVLSFWYRAGGAAWPDSITVNISKAGTEEGDFTIVLDTVGTASEEYSKYTYVLSDHPDLSPGDNIYIGLNYIGSGWFICVDDFRLGPPEGPDPKDASLSDLTLDGITIRGFNPEILDYNVDLSYDSLRVPVVGASTVNPSATPDITDASALPGMTTVVVTSEDQSVARTYTIHFNHFVLLFTEGFETGILEALPDNWKIVDGDEDQWSWYRSVGEALTDSSAAACYNPATGVATNDWLISEAISLRQGSRLSFYARVGGSTWPEDIVVRVSKTDSEVASFEFIIDTLKAFDAVKYVKFEYVLTNHPDLMAGDIIYVALQRLTAYGWYCLFDDLWLAVPVEKAATLSDLKVNGTTIDGFDPDVHTYQVGVDDAAVVTAEATNTSVIPVITNPPSLPGFATITVTSADGLVTEIYTVEITSTLGITPGQGKSAINLFPVPSLDYVNITNVERGEARFYDMTGKLVKIEEELDGEMNRIDISELKEGMYQVWILSGEESIVKSLSIIR